MILDIFFTNITFDGSLVAEKLHGRKVSNNQKFLNVKILPKISCFTSAFFKQ